MQPEKMLPFATQVVSKLVCSIQVFEVTKLNVKSKKAYSQFCGWLQAACSCRALGARTGLPHHTDPRLAPFLRQTPWAMSRATRERNGIRFYNLQLFFSSHLSVVGSSSCVLNGGRWWNGESCVGFSLSFLVKILEYHRIRNIIIFLIHGFWFFDPVLVNKIIFPHQLNVLLFTSGVSLSLSQSKEPIQSSILKPSLRLLFAHY